MSRVQYGKLSRSILLRDLESDLKGTQNIFVTQFSGIPSNQLSELRKKLNKNQSRLRVVKNSIGKRALESSEFTGAKDFLDGKCGLTLTQGDVAEISKLFVSFASENAGFKIRGAVLAGQIFNADQVKQLATLPSREELLAQIVGGLQSPISGLVRVLNQLVQNVVNVLDQIKKKKSGNE